MEDDGHSKQRIDDVCLPPNLENAVIHSETLRIACSQLLDMYIDEQYFNLGREMGALLRFGELHASGLLSSGPEQQQIADTPDSGPSDKTKPVEDYSPDKDLPVEDYSPDKDLPVEDNSPDKDSPVEDYSPEKDSPVEDYSPDKDSPVEDYSPDKDLPVEDYSPDKDLPVEDYSSDKDIFGNPLNKKYNFKCKCPICERTLAASRFARHLECCMGLGTGRYSSRSASRQPIATSGSANNNKNNLNNASSRKAGQASSSRASSQNKLNGELGSKDDDDGDWSLDRKKKSKKADEKVAGKRKEPLSKVKNTAGAGSKGRHGGSPSVANSPASLGAAECSIHDEDHSTPMSIP